MYMSFLVLGAGIKPAFRVFPQVALNSAIPLHPYFCVWFIL